MTGRLVKERRGKGRERWGASRLTGLALALKQQCWLLRCLLVVVWTAQPLPTANNSRKHKNTETSTRAPGLPLIWPGPAPAALTCMVTTRRAAAAAADGTGGTGTPPKSAPSTATKAPKTPKSPKATAKPLAKSPAAGGGKTSKARHQQYEFFGPHGPALLVLLLPATLYGLMYACNEHGCLKLWPRLEAPGWPKPTCFSWQVGWCAAATCAPDTRAHAYTHPRTHAHRPWACTSPGSLAWPRCTRSCRPGGRAAWSCPTSRASCTGSTVRALAAAHPCAHDRTSRRAQQQCASHARQCTRPAAAWASSAAPPSPRPPPRARSLPAARVHVHARALPVLLYRPPQPVVAARPLPGAADGERAVQQRAGSGAVCGVVQVRAGAGWVGVRLWGACLQQQGLRARRAAVRARACVRVSVPCLISAPLAPFCACKGAQGLQATVLVACSAPLLCAPPTHPPVRPCSAGAAPCSAATAPPATPRTTSGWAGSSTQGGAGAWAGAPPCRHAGAGARRCCCACAALERAHSPARTRPFLPGCGHFYKRVPACCRAQDGRV